MTHKPPTLADFRRIVVKVGSSLLIDAAAGCVKQGWLASLVADVARLHGEGRELLVVSSGAIALGRSVLKLPRGSLKLEDSQAAAAVGQIELARTWSAALAHHGLSAGQILVRRAVEAAGMAQPGGAHGLGLGRFRNAALFDVLHRGAPMRHRATARACGVGYRGDVSVGDEALECV